MYEGGCLCGALRFRVEVRPINSGYCHCSQCRLAGSGGTPIGGIAKESFSILTGEAVLGNFDKSDDSKFFFCSKCGSSVFTEKPSAALVHVRYGALLDTPSLSPQAHMYVGSKADWYEINDDLPQFDEAPS